MVVVDHFSKYAQAFPTKSGRAAEEILYNKYFLDFGFPQRIFHDQGREFDNKVFKQLEELIGIKQSRTTLYHPMGNGHCNRMNKSIINMLKILQEKYKSNRKNHIENSLLLTTTQSTEQPAIHPHFLLFGRRDGLPVDIIFSIEDNNFQQTNCNSYVKNWQKAMSDANKVVIQNINKRNNNNKEIYDKKFYGRNLVIGDKVFMKSFSEREGTWKLRSVWNNEIYKVVSVHKDLPMYQVQPEKGGSKIKTVHRNLLFLCNQLPSEKSFSKKVLHKQPQPPPTSVNFGSESDSELVFIHKRNVKDSTIDNNVEPEPKAEIVDSSTGDNTDFSEEIVRERQ